MSTRENENRRKFLNRHPQYSMDDVCTKLEIQKEFEKWQTRYEKNRLEYLYKGLSNDPFIRVTLEELMQELEEHPKLQDHVLAYAKDTLTENGLSDKEVTMRAIKKMNPDVLYHHDSEVRENFCECYKGGIKALQVELNTQEKLLRDKRGQYQNR